ncbi:DUF5663 domain-containing protein [Mycolicibacterium vanbaalenii]|uniref:Uncharacterized protein n=1 Tax=Mycolicibacterium vanbaalenii (strain DSM 7251 / JCM 13017 / BCRC 16820 / KCTC 9966 / NRRL B-24157 / PYR-1) TaxID=350058 RepID=A1THR9_MYCVP|nr:DUF5663 domain-containing protein [Mycolicibacterium vanbaalenii]ABM16719.1 hypothetical protein Mvan_5961 [Mycolicibacterium vanbaalenii PYR-1]MCV7128353.1 hypothetical protein [Mycolicibacterium vanbaalenii PYR-1]
MILLDDTFLSEVGLAALPAGQRQALLQRIYEELELRVGTSLTDSLSDAQVEEFEALIDHDQTAVAAWLHSVVPNFTEDPLYMAMVEKLSAATPDAVVCEGSAA